MIKKVKTTNAVRDMNITKKCEICNIFYHPRKNGYQTTSRFCSAECARTARKEKKLNWH